MKELRKNKKRKQKVGSLRCVACGEELPYSWDDNYCSNCLAEIYKIYREELEESLKSI